MSTATMSPADLSITPTVNESNVRVGPAEVRRGSTPAPVRRNVPSRSGRGTARAHSPQARPTRGVQAPSIVRSVTPRVGGGPVQHSVRTTGQYRLTERGIAVVLVAAGMIVIAAVAVIGLTALRVTSEGYQNYGQSMSGQSTATQLHGGSVSAQGADSRG